MSSSRTKCLSTKLTDVEYATLERAAGAQTLSAWARAVLLQAAARTSPDRGGGEPRGSCESDPAGAADAPGHQGGGRRLGLPTDDRRIALTCRPVDDPTPVVAWRPGMTNRSFWNSVRTANATLTRSPSWVPAMLVLACISASGIGAYRYARTWTPLQRQYLWSYAWSAIPIARSGWYTLLTIEDQTERRTALDADVVPVVPRPGGDTFALAATAVRRGAARLAWHRSEWDQAALHAFLRQGIYRDQTLFDLARPVLWGALAVLAAALVPTIADEILWAVTRPAPRSTWARSARGTNGAWRVWRRHLTRRTR